MAKSEMKVQGRSADLWTLPCWGWCASFSGILHSSSRNGSPPHVEEMRRFLQSDNRKERVEQSQRSFWERLNKQKRRNKGASITTKIVYFVLELNSNTHMILFLNDNNPATFDTYNFTVAFKSVYICILIWSLTLYVSKPWVSTLICIFAMLVPLFGWMQYGTYF